MKIPILTIAIPSYNRPLELRRCLNSIEAISNLENLEILIIDDASNKISDIAQVVNEESFNLPYKISFIVNEVNLGFDLNIAKLINTANSKYIMLMSDDDAFLPGGLDLVVNQLIHFDGGLLFTSFIDKSTGRLFRSHKSNFKIPKGMHSVNKYIYDAIMFSGLVFNRQYIVKLTLDASIKNYIQVFYFSYLMVNYESSYMKHTLFCAYGDGDNGFGNDAKSENLRLANRRDLYSDIEFHKGLISTIKAFDRKFNSNTLKSFELKYQFRTLPKLIQAKQNGFNELFLYYKEIKTLGLRYLFIAKVYVLIIAIIGGRLTTKLYKGLLILRNREVGI